MCKGHEALAGVCVGGGISLEKVLVCTERTHKETLGPSVYLGAAMDE